MAEAAGPNLKDARIEVLADEQTLAKEAARLVIGQLASGIGDHGSAHIALTGGSLAVPFYKELRGGDARRALDWSKVHLWWGDERFVPIDHPQSNAGAAYSVLLAVAELAGQSGDGGQYDDVVAGSNPGLLINPAHVHPVEVEETMGDDAPVELAAERYARELSRYVPLGRHGVPIFDVVMSGIGPDGHIMSLFPGSPGLAADAPVVLGIPAPSHVEPHLDRVTLSARVLAPAGLVLLMAAGDRKADIVGQVLAGQDDVDRWPARAALLPNAVWLLDEAAAAGWRRQAP